MKKIFSTISLVFCCINVFAQVWVINNRITASYDSNATAANNAGSVSTQLDRTATTTLCKGLKNFGLFYKYTFIYHINGGTSTAHAVNLRAVGTNTMTYVGSPAHNSSGVDPNGTTQYGNTGVANTTINENAAHISFRSGETVSGGELGVSWGTDDGTNHGGIFVNFGNQLYSDFPQESCCRIQLNSIISPIGLISQDLGASRAHVVYRNGSSIASRTNTAMTTFTSGTILWNARSVAPDFMGTKNLQWLAYAPVAFSATDVANEYTVELNYQTMKGR